MSDRDDLETEMDFGNNEPRKTENITEVEHSNSSGSAVFHNTGNDGYDIVQRDKGDAKGASGEILIETATKGLLYRCEVFKDGTLIDAREIDCKDLLSNEEKEYIFKQRYMATHNTYKMQYIAAEFFKELESNEGEFIDDNKQHCKVVTSYSDETIRTIIYLDGNEFETKEMSIPDNLKGNKKLLETRCLKFHQNNIQSYIDVAKFPVNIEWLNNILKKLPFYKNKPMHAFYLFLGLLVLLLFIVKFGYCSYQGTLKDGKLAKNKFGESICHTLEERCMYSKESGWKKEMKPSFKQCQGFYFKKRVFSQAAYERIFDGSEIAKKAAECQQQKDDGWKNKELKESCQDLCDSATIDKKICKDVVVSYSIAPNTLTLNVYDGKSVYLTNNSEKTLTFRVESMTLDDRSLPKIVRIVGLHESRTLAPGEEDEFIFGLTKSAANLFDNREYTGNIRILVISDGEEKHKDIKFKFNINL